jgi:hypothetical protein
VKLHVKPFEEHLESQVFWPDILVRVPGVQGSAPDKGHKQNKVLGAQSQPSFPHISSCQKSLFKPSYAAMSQVPARSPQSCVFIAIFVVIPLLLTATPGFASSRQKQERAARKACLNGDYTKGVSILSELFVDTQDSAYIFNQGRCFEQNRQYEEAVARFEEYMRTSGTKLRPEDKAAAETHIADCKEKLGKARSDSPLQPTPPPVVAPAATPPAPEPAPTPTPPEPATSLVAQPAPPPAPGERRWGLVTTGIIASVVGAGGVVTGVIFNLKANSTADERQTKVGSYNAKANEQKNYKTLAWVGYGAGAACAVAGAILIGIGAVKSSPSSSTDVAFVPAVGPGQVGAMLTGGF